MKSLQTSAIGITILALSLVVTALLYGTPLWLIWTLLSPTYLPFVSPTYTGIGYLDAIGIVLGAVILRDVFTQNK